MRKPTSSELTRAESVDQLMERGKGGVGEYGKRGALKRFRVCVFGWVGWLLCVGSRANVKLHE